MHLQRPATISLTLSGADKVDDSDDEILHFLFLQGEGKHPELIDIVTQATPDGNLVLSGQINLFSDAFPLAVPDNKRFCTTTWTPSIDNYNELFSVPNAIIGESASLAIDLNVELKPTLNEVCAGFNDGHLVVSIDASVYEKTVINFSGTGTLNKLWTSESITFSLPGGVLWVGPIPVMPQVDLFVQAGINLDLMTTVRFEQSADYTISVDYKRGAWMIEKNSFQCQGAEVMSAQEFRAKCLIKEEQKINASGTARAIGWGQLSFLVMWTGGPYLRVGPRLTLEAEAGYGQEPWWTVCGELLAGYGITGNPKLFGAQVALGKDLALNEPFLIYSSPPSIETCGEGPSIKPGGELVFGNMFFNNRPITQATKKKPLIKLKGREPEQTCIGLRRSNTWMPVVYKYDNLTGEFELRLRPGYYCILPTIDAAEPFEGSGTWPGDYLSGSGHGTQISLATGEIKNLDLIFKQFIHLISPRDNAAETFVSKERRAEVFTTPLELRWEPIPEAVSYRIIIRVCDIDSVPCENREEVVRELVEESQLILNLPPNQGIKIYWLLIRAINDKGESITRFWARYGSSLRNEGLYFRVKAP